MGKPALQAPAFSMGSGQTNGNPEEGSPDTLLYAASPPPPAGTKAPDGATPRMGRLAPKTGQRNIRAGAAQPQKRNLAMSGMERCNPKKRNRATSELERRNQKTERRNVGYEAT